MREQERSNLSYTKRKEMCSDGHVAGCDEVTLVIARACSAGGFRKEREWKVGKSKKNTVVEKEL
jgi:hypothetical protein